MAHTVVIADDVTGANDIGIMYAKADLDTLVYSYAEGKTADYQDSDVLIVDTDSRFDTGKEAYQKVFGALSQIQKEGVHQYINKQCSVFRGNIGAEFDAMLDALGETFAVVVPGFPDNGRTTLHSQHYVYGTPLKESQFRHDPVHPMNQSDLREILGSQTKRPVGFIHYETYDGGEAAVCQELEQARIRGGYCIMDVRHNEDLKFLAGILKDETIICGSSALSAYLAKVQRFPKKDVERYSAPIWNHKVFCMAGSLTPQTVGQTAYMKEHGYPVYELNTRKLLEEKSRKDECRRIAEAVVQAYEQHDFVMIHSMNRPELVEQTKQQAGSLGIDNRGVSTLVSGALSEVAESVINRCGIQKIIVCGGDTSASLCAKLEVKGMRVLEEIETGLPTCQSVSRPCYQLVLKSGSFGSPEFIEKAILKLGGGKTMSVTAHVEKLTERYPALESCRDQIMDAFLLLKSTYDRKGMVLVCGNGGSGADSEHIVGELMKEFAIKRPMPVEEQERLLQIAPEHGRILAEHLQGALPAITLTGNIALSTAFANDAVPELVFAQQVYGYGAPEHALIGISTSGNSENVIYALQTARIKKMAVIGLTGQSGGRMKEICDVCICVPACSTPEIQEFHLPVYHTLCKMLEEEYFG